MPQLLTQRVKLTTSSNELTITLSIGGYSLKFGKKEYLKLHENLDLIMTQVSVRIENVKKYDTCLRKSEDFSSTKFLLYFQ